MTDQAKNSIRKFGSHAARTFFPEGKGASAALMLMGGLAIIMKLRSVTNTLN